MRRQLSAELGQPGIRVVTLRTGGNNFFISISTDSEAEADKLFDGLSAGGQATMPLAKAFWGAYFGMLTDKFGVQWMVSYDYNQ